MTIVTMLESMVPVRWVSSTSSTQFVGDVRTSGAWRGAEGTGCLMLVLGFVLAIRFCVLFSFPPGRRVEIAGNISSVLKVLTSRRDLCFTSENALWNSSVDNFPAKDVEAEWHSSVAHGVHSAERGSPI
ncbi:hypothetical protein VTN00DRAFT_746 [Thermoascus crustaceus]|uniref:uncharacterized protein n=1 Tax=Thermoascus crustaceus TaxID=5088 RepID=UPI003742FCF8